MDCEEVWIECDNEPSMIACGNNLSYTPVYYDECLDHLKNANHAFSKMYHHQAASANLAYNNYQMQLPMPDEQNTNARFNSYLSYPSSTNYANKNVRSRKFYNEPPWISEIEATRNYSSMYQKPVKYFPHMGMVRADMRHSQMKQTPKRKRRQPYSMRKTCKLLENVTSNDGQIDDMNKNTGEFMQNKSFDLANFKVIQSNQELTENVSFVDNAPSKMQYISNTINQMKEQETNFPVTQKDYKIPGMSLNHCPDSEYSISAAQTIDGTYNSKDTSNILNDNLNFINGNSSENYNEAINNSTNTAINSKIYTKNETQSTDCTKLLDAAESHAEESNFSVETQDDKMNIEIMPSEEMFILQPFFEGTDENGREVIVLLAAPSQNQTSNANSGPLLLQNQVSEMNNSLEFPQKEVQIKILEDINVEHATNSTKMLKMETESKIAYFSNLDDYGSEETIQCCNYPQEKLLKNHDKNKSINKQMKNKRAMCQRNTESINRKEIKSVKDPLEDKLKFDTSRINMLQVKDGNHETPHNVKISNQATYKTKKKYTSYIVQNKLKWKTRFQWKSKERTLYALQNNYLHKLINFCIIKMKIRKDNKAIRILKVIINKIGGHIIKLIYGILYDLKTICRRKKHKNIIKLL